MSGSIPSTSLEHDFNNLHANNDFQFPTDSFVLSPSKRSFLGEKLDRLRHTHDLDLSEDQNEQIKATIASFSCLFFETLLSQPMITLRTQCQINVDSTSNHILPFSILSPTLNLIKSQGVTCLWKGMTTTFIIHGLNLIVENVISDLLQYPRDIDFNKSSNKEISQHITLKSITYAIMTPFYAANILQNIQSYIIYSDETGNGLLSNNVVDLFKDSYHIFINCFSSFIGMMTDWLFKPFGSSAASNGLGNTLLNILPTPNIIIEKTIYSGRHKVLESLPPSKANLLTKYLFINKWAAWTIIPVCISFCLAHYLSTRYFENLLAKILNSVEKEARRRKRKIKVATHDPAYSTPATPSSSFDETECSLIGPPTDGDFVHVKPPSSKRISPRTQAYQNHRIVTALTANFGARILADIVCYPLLTATNIILLRSMMNNVFPRRHVIIDDLDTGLRIEPLGHHYIPLDSLVIDENLIALTEDKTSVLHDKLGIRLKYFKPLHLFRGFGIVPYLALLRYGIINCAELLINSPVFYFD